MGEKQVIYEKKFGGLQKPFLAGQKKTFLVSIESEALGGLHLEASSLRPPEGPK
jgi:hypothetical protein